MDPHVSPEDYAKAREHGPVTRVSFSFSDKEGVTPDADIREFLKQEHLFVSRYDDVPAADLRELTVRTSSVQVHGFPQLWPWIRRLTPRPSLEAFTLNAFSTQGEALIPRGFILDMAGTHRGTLRHFTADWTQMTFADIECLCSHFPVLETLSCSTMWSPDGVCRSPTFCWWRFTDRFHFGADAIRGGSR